MATRLCFLQRALDQRLADAVLAERRLDRERPEQQRRRRADTDRRQPHRADEQRADAGGERQFEPVVGALAQPIGGLGEAAGTEGALVQALDRERVVGGLRQDGEVGHRQSRAAA